MDSIICKICKSEYDESIKIPRILIKCGHTFCQLCILKLLNNDNKLVCPQDEIIYFDINLPEEIFPVNLNLINIIKTNKEIQNSKTLQGNNLYFYNNL